MQERAQETDRDRQAVEEFWGALHQTLPPEELADGWTEPSRAASSDAMGRVRADLRSGWGDQADYASHHLVRSHDYWGVNIHGEGRLITLATAAQEALIRLRPAH